MQNLSELTEQLVQPSSNSPVDGYTGCFTYVSEYT